MRRLACNWISTTGLSVIGAVAMAIGTTTVSAPALGQSFEEALALSYATSPTLAAQRAQLRATNEEIAQALAGYRPSLEATGSAGVEWADTEFDEIAGDQEETLNPASLGIQLVQPIYRGGRTRASVTQAENAIQAARAAYLAVEQNVLLNAVIAYMNVVSAQAVLDLARNNEEVLQRQLQATRDRFEVGEVTRTDVSQAEAAVSGAVANRINAEGALSGARATFARVVGQLPGVLEPPDPIVRLPTSLEEAVLLAETNNPTVIAQQFTEEAAEAGIDIVQGELLPEVSVAGQIRRSYEPSNAISRTDGASIVAQVVVPLYQSGGVSSRVRQARHSANEERIRVVETRREVIEAAIQGWEGLMTARASIESLLAQVRAAEIALEGVRQEALVGSRTVLDVLDAEQDLLDARVDLVEAQRDETVAAFQLLAAVGEMTARDLELPVDYYQFDPEYNEVRRSWWGTDIEPIEIVD